MKYVHSEMWFGLRPLLTNMAFFKKFQEFLLDIGNPLPLQHLSHRLRSEMTQRMNVVISRYSISHKSKVFNCVTGFFLNNLETASMNSSLI